jgi:hypothetical protein
MTRKTRYKKIDMHILKTGSTINLVTLVTGGEIWVQNIL